jgi:hypothetical protein
MLAKVTDMAHIRPLWPVIREGLDQVAAHSPDSWIAEDVFMALASGAAFLYTSSTDEGRYAGFVVLTFSQGYAGRECHVWCAYHCARSELLPEEDAQLASIAKEEGCKYLTFFSPRPGWEKRAADLGWQKVHTLYRKDLA